VIGMRRRIFFPLCNGYTVILFVTFAGADKPTTAGEMRCCR
jgi:hypothetical protein